jgi:hypothetical protein
VLATIKEKLIVKMKIFKIITIVFLSWLSSCIGQNQSKTIFFFKPYTDISETNRYSDLEIEFNYKIQYENIKSANIEFEVENAIRNKDFRIIALSGNSYVFPGLDGGYEINADGSKAFIGISPLYEPYIERNGFKVIQGTSDNINPNDLPLQSISYNFAKKYNMLLIKKVEKLKEE